MSHHQCSCDAPPGQGRAGQGRAGQDIYILKEYIKFLKKCQDLFFKSESGRLPGKLFL